MKRILLSFGVATWAAVAACSSSSSSSQGSGSGTETASAQCTRVLDAYCGHAVNDCHESGTVTDCVNAGVSACCKTQCSATAVSTDSSIDVCVQAMQMLSCTDLAAQKVPPVCVGVVKIMDFEPHVDLRSFGARLSSSPQ